MVTDKLSVSPQVSDCSIGRYFGYKENGTHLQNLELSCHEHIEFIAWRALCNDLLASKYINRMDHGTDRTNHRISQIPKHRNVGDVLAVAVVYKQHEKQVR